MKPKKKGGTVRSQLRHAGGVAWPVLRIQLSIEVKIQRCERIGCEVFKFMY